MFALISDLAARAAHNNGKLTVYLPTRPLNYNVKYSYLPFLLGTCVCSGENEIKKRGGWERTGRGMGKRMGTEQFFSWGCVEDERITMIVKRNEYLNI